MPKQPERKRIESSQDKVEVEPGFEKRLGDMYKKVLHAPPKHVPDKRTKASKDK